MGLTSLGSVLCRLLLYTSTAFNTLNTLSVEFQTPPHISPRSMLFCFNDTSFALNKTSFAVNTLTEGGSIFSLTEQTILSGGKDFNRSTFFTQAKVATGALQPIEYGSLREVLATDPYYARTYLNERCARSSQAWGWLTAAMLRCAGSAGTGTMHAGHARTTPHKLNRLPALQV